MISSHLIRSHPNSSISCAIRDALPSFAQSAAVQVDALQLLHAVLHNVDATGGRRQRTPFRRNATDPQLSNFANFPLHGIMASNQTRCCDMILIEIVYYIHHYTSIYIYISWLFMRSSWHAMCIKSPVFESSRELLCKAQQGSSPCCAFQPPEIRGYGQFLQQPPPDPVELLEVFVRNSIGSLKFGSQLCEFGGRVVVPMLLLNCTNVPMTIQWQRRRRSKAHGGWSLRTCIVFAHGMKPSSSEERTDIASPAQVQNDMRCHCKLWIRSQGQLRSALDMLPLQPLQWNPWTKADLVAVIIIHLRCM